MCCMFIFMTSLYVDILFASFIRPSVVQRPPLTSSSMSANQEAGHVVVGKAIRPLAFLKYLCDLLCGF